MRETVKKRGVSRSFLVQFLVGRAVEAGEA
jgi:hypothetical protein